MPLAVAPATAGAASMAWLRCAPYAKACFVKYLMAEYLIPKAWEMELVLWLAVAPLEAMVQSAEQDSPQVATA